MSLAFAAGGVLGGALTPIAAQTLSAEGMAGYTGLLLTAAGLVTFVATRVARPAD